MENITLPDWVKPGAKYRYQNGPDGQLLHEVRAIVDDQVIVRVWWKRKQRWNYSVESFYWFDGNDWIEPVKDRKATAAA